MTEFSHYVIIQLFEQMTVVKHQPVAVISSFVQH